MSLTELLPSVQELPQADKLRLMQWLAAQLADEKTVSVLSPKVEYPIWSPCDAYEAASSLSSFLVNARTARLLGA